MIERKAYRVLVHCEYFRGTTIGPNENLIKISLSHSNHAPGEFLQESSLGLAHPGEHSGLRSIV